jgi:hypothetical protein
MPHRLSGQRMSRLQANKRAMDHFERNKETYKRYSRHFLALSMMINDFSHLKNDDTRASLIKTYILESDRSVWGLKTDWMTAEEIADSYAHLVIGHENEK